MQDPLVNPSDPLSCERSFHDRRLKPHADQVLKCPRCDSLNTKFCYFNNYSLTQPRHFCKNCKRYWTKGGALRNVPVGGGCRKNKRTKQRVTEQAPSPAPGEDAILSSIHGDGSSSSSSLHQDFSGRTSSPSLYTPNDGDGGFSLTFERLEQAASRSYGLSNAPISINWAVAGQVPAPPTLNLQPFDSNILALNLTGRHLNQEQPTQESNGHSDLSSLYDPPVNLAAQSSISLNENLIPYNLCIESVGAFGQGNGDLQWRLPPKLVTIVEERHSSNGKPLMQNGENLASENFKFPKGKLLDFIVPRADLDGPVSSPVWPPAAVDSFFDTAGDAGYWNNVTLPPDLAMYGIAGGQLL